MENILFDFTKVLNLEKYFQFIEIYLKINKISKKEFLNEVNINAGTYRYFLNDINKNAEKFYEKISEAMNIKLPDEKNVKKLNIEFTSYYYNLLYGNYDGLEQDIKTIDSYLKEEINSIEELFYLIMSCLIKVSLGLFNYDEQRKFLEKAYNLLSPYKEVLVDEFKVLYEVLVYEKEMLEDCDIISKAHYLRKISKPYEELKGFVLNLISFSMYYRGDYMNAIIYANDACDIIYKQNNYIKLIDIKSNIAHYYLLLGDYERSYQIYNELSYSSRILDKVAYANINSGLFDSLLLLNNYEMAYEIYNSNDLKSIKSVVLDICYLYICYKMNKVEEVDKQLVVFNDLFINENIFQPYVDMVNYLKIKHISKANAYNKRKILNSIDELKNKVTKLIFEKIVNF